MYTTHQSVEFGKSTYNRATLVPAQNIVLGASRLVQFVKRQQNPATWVISHLGPVIFPFHTHQGSVSKPPAGVTK